jgi:hypothetical protein
MDEPGDLSLRGWEGACVGPGIPWLFVAGKCKRLIGALCEMFCGLKKAKEKRVFRLAGLTQDTSLWS